MDKTIPIEDKPECTHCESCEPQDYWTMVDISFLRGVENLMRHLDDIKPVWYYSVGFKKKVDKHIREARRTGNRNYK